MPFMEDQLTLATYVAALSKIETVIRAWETLIASATERPADAFLEGRGRLGAIRKDLEALGRTPREQSVCDLPPFDGVAELLGGLYVMEGSRLGGQWIAQHVEKVLALEPGHGTLYFRGFGDQTGRRWKQFIDLLQSDVPDADSDRVIAGAKKMFAAFHACMQR